MKIRRGNYCYGPWHPKVKLTTEQVDAMRAARENDGWSYGRCAQYWNCGYSTVRDILKFRTRVYC